MSDLQLVIGDKNRSAPSLSAWLMLRQLGLEFEEVLIPLGREDTAERIRAWSPSGGLPLLVAGEIRVWEALAIGEFLADHFPTLWPEAAADRALARSISAESQCALRDLQLFLPFDLTARFTPPGRLLASVAAQLDRVIEIWTDCRTRFGREGPFLFGQFTVADAMFAPLCARLTTHAIPLDEPCRGYAGHMLGLPAMLEWAEDARAEVGGIAAPPPVAAAPAPPPRAAAPAPPPRPPEPVAPSAAAPAPAVPEPAILEPEEPFLEEEDDGVMPAPGLPGVIPTRPYEEPEAVEPSAGRRLLRPPVATGLFRWRQPQRLAEQVAGVESSLPPREPLKAPPAPVEPPRAPSPERRPIMREATAAPAPAPPPPRAPVPERPPIARETPAAPVPAPPQPAAPAYRAPPAPPSGPAPGRSAPFADRPPARPPADMPPARAPLSVPPAYAARVRGGPMPRVTEPPAPATPPPPPSTPAPPPAYMPRPTTSAGPPPAVMPPLYQPARAAEPGPVSGPPPRRADVPPAAPPPPPPAEPASSADELPPDFPATLRPVRRYETIKPIGDGIRRRR